MKTSLESQIEEMNARIRDSKELLKMFFNGEEYYKQRIKKLKTDFGQEVLQQQLESTNVNELKAKIDEMTSQVQLLKKFKPMLSIYRDGSEAERPISLHNVQQFVLSLFGANLYEVGFGLVKNPDRLARVAVFMIEDDRLARLVFDRTSPSFEHHLQYTDEENWCPNFLRITFKKAPTDFEARKAARMNGLSAGLTNGEAVLGSPNHAQSNRNESVSKDDQRTDHQVNHQADRQVNCQVNQQINHQINHQINPQTNPQINQKPDQSKENSQQPAKSRSNANSSKRNGHNKPFTRKGKFFSEANS